MIIPITEWKTL